MRIDLHLRSSGNSQRTVTAREILYFWKYKIFILRILYGNKDMDVNWLFRRRSLKQEYFFSSNKLRTSENYESQDRSHSASGIRFKSASREDEAKISVILEARTLPGFRSATTPFQNTPRSRPVRYISVCTRTNYRRHAAASRCESPKCWREIHSSDSYPEIPRSHCSRYESVTKDTDKLTPVYT